MQIVFVAGVALVTGGGARLLSVVGGASSLNVMLIRVPVTSSDATAGTEWS